jgi:hypothetical protein
MSTSNLGSRLVVIGETVLGLGLVEAGIKQWSRTDLLAILPETAS